jgi:hypothetical protein
MRPIILDYDFERDIGSWENGERIYRHASAGFERILGVEHKSTLVTMTDLGMLYLKQEKLSDAEAMFRRTLNRCVVFLRPEHQWTFSVMDTLGSV